MLTGTVALKDDPFLILSVNGVGYKVAVPLGVLAQKALEEDLTLFIHTHVREDALELYGFLEKADLDIFEKLISVSGVGRKSAIAIFSLANRGEIINAIVKGDAAFFTAVPRLGKKNAQKIIIELRSKIADTGEDLDLSVDGEGVDEVLAALKQFGFSQREALSALRQIATEGKTVDEQLRLALKQLGK